MLTNSPARGREDAGRHKSPFMRHLAQGGKAVMVRESAPRPALGRMRAATYLALLLAVPAAATCIAMGHAGVPALFSTACGVVSCAAADRAP